MGKYHYKFTVVWYNLYQLQNQITLDLTVSFSKQIKYNILWHIFKYIINNLNNIGFMISKCFMDKI